ncbi:MAG: DivIVA domain-containing protein [Clostridia bacterium]|nr:DivIVA domain-containing protein [Clostridia bacterium]
MYTPLELERMEFETKMGGYRKGNVDEVFSLLRKDYETLYKENISLKDKVSMLEELVSKYKSMEDSMNNALVLAQTTGETVIRSANEKAENIIKQAQMKAAEMEKEAEKEIRDLIAKAEDMKKSISVFAAKNISLLNAQTEILKSMADEAINPIANNNEE